MPALTPTAEGQEQIADTSSRQTVTTSQNNHQHIEPSEEQRRMPVLGTTVSNDNTATSAISIPMQGIPLPVPQEGQPTSQLTIYSSQTLRQNIICFILCFVTELGISANTSLGVFPKTLPPEKATGIVAGCSITGCASFLALCASLKLESLLIKDITRRPTQYIDVSAIEITGKYKNWAARVLFGLLASTSMYTLSMLAVNVYFTVIASNDSQEQTFGSIEKIVFGIVITLEAVGAIITGIIAKKLSDWHPTTLTIDQTFINQTATIVATEGIVNTGNTTEGEALRQESIQPQRYNSTSGAPTLFIPAETNANNNPNTPLLQTYAPVSYQ